MPQIKLNLNPFLNKKQITKIVGEYVFSSRIEDYFEIPDSRETAIDKEGDFYIIKLRPTLLLSNTHRGPTVWAPPTPSWSFHALMGHSLHYQQAMSDNNYYGNTLCNLLPRNYP